MVPKECNFVDEHWKWIKGFEGLYQISDCGRVKSYWRNKNGALLSAKNSKGWYLSVQLCRGGGNKVTSRIHVLVTEAFIGEIPDGYEVHHKDDNKQHNYVGNLEILETKQHKILTLLEHPECIQGMCNAAKYTLRTPIKQYTLDGFFVAEYANASIAEQYTGVCGRNILQVANKEPFNKKGSVRKQAGGYMWKFAENAEAARKRA